MVLVDVNGSVSKLSIAEREDLEEEGEKPDCLVLVYSIEDQKSFGKQNLVNEIFGVRNEILKFRNGEDIKSLMIFSRFCTFHPGKTGELRWAGLRRDPGGEQDGPGQEQAGQVQGTGAQGGLRESHVDFARREETWHFSTVWNS